jgi:hypothetical protein
MNFQLSSLSAQLFLLLAGTVPTLIIASHAGATQANKISLPEVNFAGNTAEKLQMFVPQSQLIARTEKKEIIIDTGTVKLKCIATVTDGEVVDIECPKPPSNPFAQAGNPFVRSVKSETMKSKADLSRPSAVEVLRSLQHK